MACEYRIYTKNGEIVGEYSYEELVNFFEQGGYKDFSDIIFKKGTKQDAIRSEVLKANKDFKIKMSESKHDSNPEYTSGDSFTTQSLIDSGYFRFKGIEIVREQNDEDYVKNAAKAFIEESKRLGSEISQEEAVQKAEKQLEKWDVINKDAKELHSLLNKFNFDEDDLYDFIKLLKGTKFENLAGSIYQQISQTEKNSLMRIIKGKHNLEANGHTKVLQGINLSAKLNHIGKNIIGHFDNLVIDTNGTLHIYNYKFTSTPVSEWDFVKKEKYFYQIALLKQILAYNGFDVSRTQLHIIPVRVDYSEDLSQINSINVYAQNELAIPTGNRFEQYEIAAKYFIKSNINIEPIKDNTVKKINKILGDIFPERNVAYDGIRKTVDEWINHNYSSKWQSRIKKVDAETHTYEVFLDDEFEKAIKIKDSTEPIKNEEIRELIFNHIKDSNTSNSNFLKKIVDELLSSKRQGRLSLSSSNIPSVQLAKSFIEKSLAKYILDYDVLENGDKDFEWELISNDTLIDSNILLFKNKQDQVDVVVLSDYNLKASTSFKNRKNIMGSYISDTNAGGLINYRANYANIEAVRTMTVLNEILPQINQSDFTLGEMKIISTQQGGMLELYNMESLNKDLFQEIIKTVKYNVDNFNYTNNFTKSKYIDPLKIITMNYNDIISSSDLSKSQEQEINDLGFDNLSGLRTREQKCVELRSLIQKIFKLDSTLESMTPQSIIDCANNSPNKQKRVLANLYMLCQDAYCYYSGTPIQNEYKVNKVKEYLLTQNRINNKTYQGVVVEFTNAVDSIAAKVRKEYNHIYDFTMKFYDSKNFGTLNASVLGNQVKAFDNLYERNDNNKKMMRFRNPYKSDSLPPLSTSEKSYLKRVLFEFAKIRSEIYGFDFDFNVSDIETPSYLSFIEKNKKWYFNPPLEKASPATIRAKGFNNVIKEWANRAKELLNHPKESFDKLVSGFGTQQEAELMENTFHTLHLQNSYVLSDGIGETSYREDLINQHPQDYWETNVENLLAHYLEKHIQVKEFNKTLISVKGTLLQLELLKGQVGDSNQQGLIQTIKMVQDFTKQNIFNVSIMEPETQKIVAWMHPFRQLVSKAYIAGNITSMFRDVFEGLWQNTSRVLNKYQTDIEAKNLKDAYKEVTKASFTSIRNITIIDELCKTYRLSNLDVARISEGLTTSRGGVLNIENWMYSTLRAPDFLNRMVLFVAKCMKDGSWEAFDLKDNQLVYDWKKDKRYSIYADKSKKGTKEYEEQRIAYYNAVRQYNLENPENTITFDDDLPVAYSNDQIQQMRNLSNSIYGAYDKSMRAKYESTALGLTFGMFSTWMNGMVTNYLAEPGQYSGVITDVEQDKDGSGNLLFMDKYGLPVVEIISNEGKQYIYQDTGEMVSDLEGMVPIMKNVPRVVQGIWYTIKDGIMALRNNGIKGFKEEILADPTQTANLKKLIHDMIMFMLFAGLYKLAIDPMYKDYKKHSKENSFVENAMAEILYKSTSRSYDGFSGPLALINFLGENTNPPTYTLPTKVMSDLGKFVFGDKTFGQLITGHIAFFRTFKDSYNTELKKD